MPQPRRRKPTPPRAPSPSGRLRLAPLRPIESVALDRQGEVRRGSQSFPMPPYVKWPEFMHVLADTWHMGAPDWPNPNVAMVGAAGSGKTTLARQILQLRDRVCVFGTKTQDASLYGPFQRLGYVLRSEWSPERVDEPRVIFRPPLAVPTRAALFQQQEAFRRALLAVFQTGGWTLYFDEVRYLTETLRLANELNLLWLQGRSLGICMVAGTQRPVSVPINMFEQSRFSFLWRISGAEDRKTASDYTGANAPVVREVTAVLPPHEALFVDAERDTLIRTRVERPR